jgi:sterol desaturase/sphingolipid hydroxylase (fatty acid hydroxylase superfamily)/CDGSH-type Zn-finger protein
MDAFLLFTAHHSLALILGILVFFGLLETFAGYFRHSKRTKDDVLTETVNTFVLMVVTKPAVVFVAATLMKFLLPTLENSIVHWNLIFSLCVFMFSDDFLQYWYHRKAHEIKWLWKWHRAHHTAEEMGLLVSYRQAIWYFVLMPNIWLMGVYTYLGGGIPMLAAIFFKQIVVISSHSLVTWDSFFYRRPWLNPVTTVLERIFITPAFHHAHHAKSIVDSIGNPNGNYGNMFSIWDQLFGSAKFTRQFPTDYGVQDDPHDAWTAQCFYPLVASDKPTSELSRAYVFEKTTVNEPAVATLAAGDYLWCQCGYSKNQPFCDGSHHGTTSQPLKFTIRKEMEYELCNCKKCEKGPFCDGSHEKR